MRSSCLRYFSTIFVIWWNNDSDNFDDGDNVDIANIGNVDADFQNFVSGNDEGIARCNAGVSEQGESGVYFNQLHNKAKHSWQVRKKHQKTMKISDEKYFSFL